MPFIQLDSISYNNLNMIEITIIHEFCSINYKINFNINMGDKSVQYTNILGR